MNWLLNRLSEPSTWRGLVWLATAAGLSLRPDQAEAIGIAGMALAGLLGAFLADTPNAPTESQPPRNPAADGVAGGVRAAVPPDGGDPSGNGSGWNG